jgi:hypothetical protein
MTVPRLLQFHVCLIDSEPPIWRRFQINEQATLADLHRVLQSVMGWQNRHDYRFTRRGDRDPTAPPITYTNHQEASSVPLIALDLMPGETLTYTYDFADGWLHRLTLEAISPPPAPPTLPICLDGERACPPEHCGGIWGYEELLERLGDPDDPAYEFLLAEYGFDFDPDAFDITAVNQRLRSIPP